MSRPFVPYSFPPLQIERRVRSAEETEEWERMVEKMVERVEHRDFLAEARVLLGTVNSPQMVRARARRRVERLRITLGKLLKLRRESERLRSAGARSWEWNAPKVQADNAAIRFGITVARTRALAAGGCDICASWLEGHAEEIAEAMGDKPAS